MRDTFALSFTRGRSRVLQAALLAALGLLASSLAPAEASEAGSGWVSAWSTGLMTADTAHPPPFAQGPTTVRQVVRLTGGGKRVRLRLSNAFGSGPLQIDAARLALSSKPKSAAIDPSSVRKVTFDGRDWVIIPPGAVYLSDPVDMPVAPLARLAVTLQFPVAPPGATIHRAARTTTYLAAGADPSAADLPAAATILQWLQLSAVEVENPKAVVIAAFGDSITDGSGTRDNSYQRWPDLLAERLQADPKRRHWAIINAGIGGNRLLKDGLSPSGLARLDRDALSLPGVQTLIVLIGVNDIGFVSREGPVTPDTRQIVVEGLKSGYRQVVERAHARGVRVVGATILPFGGAKAYRSDADADADRQAVNDWIRTSGVFDAVIDLDAVVRDQDRPATLRAEYDSGDHLHPSPAGYRAIADAIPLDLLVARRR